MTAMLADDNYGVLTEPATLTIVRVLPGPIERVWSYIADSDLRRLWLAAGAMEEKAGAPVELTWRNDALTDPPGNRPEGMGAEHSMTCEIVEIDAPRKLAISWGSTGGVTFTLSEKGDEVLLTLVHKRVEDRAVLLNVSAGWHAHFDVLEARLRGTAAKPHWDNWAQLKADYAERFAG